MASPEIQTQSFYIPPWFCHRKKQRLKQYSEVIPNYCLCCSCGCACMCVSVCLCVCMCAPSQKVGVACVILDINFLRYPKEILNNLLGWKIELFIWVLWLVCQLNHFCVVKYFLEVVLERKSFTFLYFLEIQKFRFPGDGTSLASGFFNNQIYLF